MKKITLFAFLAVPLFSLQMRGQDLQTRNRVVQSYDVSTAQLEINAITQQAQVEKEKAYEVAIERGVQTSGVGIDGNYFELDRIDENGLLFFKTTLGIGARATVRAEGLVANNNNNKGLALNGKDMIVGVIDAMSALGDHREFAESTLSKKTRVIEQDAIPRVPSTYKEKNDYEKSRSHATHVSGIIASGGYYGGGDSKGIAPSAQVLSYNWSSDINKMSKMASDGVLVSNHSYGNSFFDEYGNLRGESYRNLFGAYDQSSYRFDVVANKYPYYLPVTAAGNDGDYQEEVYKNFSTKKNVDMLNGTAVSKNVVVVAAVHEVLNYTGAKSVELADFSSQGPADDFRIKPDIAAKGVKVYSTTYYAPNVPTDAPDIHRYQNMDGTSMAAPAVTAVFAIWQEWAVKYSEEKMPYKASTIRALMAHTADEAGVAPGPDHLFGWGLINASAGIKVLEGARNEGGALVLENVLDQGGKFTKEVVVTEKNQKIVVTIAWNDPAFTKYTSGFGYNEKNMINSPTLVNDLDIVLKKGDLTYLPWRLTKNFVNLKAEKGNNNVDNIEKIELLAAEPGTYEIIVSHKGSLVGGSQEYSMVMSLGEFENLKSTVKEEEKGEEKEEDKGNEENESPIDESNADNEVFSIWPNPVANDMNVRVGARYYDQVASVRVFDIDGKMVRDFKGYVEYDGKVTVNMGSLTSGSYFVEVKTGKFKKKVRIMKR